MGKLTVVVGGQYGSEGKGAISAYLSRQLGRGDVAIRVAGPNAGHTVYDQLGRQYKLRQVPVAAVTSTCRLHIAAGSEIDMHVLDSEVTQLDADGYRVRERLQIHPSATIIEPHHPQREQLDGLPHAIGSTGKGIGAARADRIMRRAKIAAQIPSVPGTLGWDDHEPFGVAGDRHLLIEGTQGYGLGLHHDNYPAVTSSDCRAIDFMAMAGVSPWDTCCDELNIWVVARVYPIRVAGNSGPLRGETTWEALGLPEEHTTVTGRVRRVGEWDSRLVAGAVAANGGSPGVKLALTMLDQKFPEVAGITDWERLCQHPDPLDFIYWVEDEVQAKIGLVGTGPRSVVEVP